MQHLFGRIVRFAGKLGRGKLEKNGVPKPVSTQDVASSESEANPSIEEALEELEGAGGVCYAFAAKK